MHHQKLLGNGKYPILSFKTTDEPSKQSLESMGFMDTPSEESEEIIEKPSRFTFGFLKGSRKFGRESIEPKEVTMNSNRKSS